MAQHDPLQAEKVKVPDLPHLPPRARILDLCCGTGLSTAALRRTYPESNIVAMDASAGMLREARRRRPGMARWVQGNAMRPQDSGIEGPFDGILMAYGIRNMPDRDACLVNLRSLLATDGTICFPEYSVSDSLFARLVFNAIPLGVVIPLGLLTSPRSGIYRYLRRSVLRFDGVKDFEERLRRAGFADVETLPMDGWARGIVHSFLARPASD